MLEGLLGAIPGCRVPRVPPEQVEIDCVFLDGEVEPEDIPQWWREQTEVERPVLALAASHPTLPHLPPSQLTETTLPIAISWAKQHRAWRAGEESAQKRTRQILAQVTHELRSPITVISLATQMAMRQNVKPEKLLEHLSMVRESSMVLQTLVNDILDFSKMSSGTLELASTEFELREFLQNVSRSYQLLAEEKGLVLRFESDATLPSRLVGDPGRLRQILANLLSNAVKFTSQGQIELSVSLSSKSFSEVVPQFRVRDSGIGIPEDSLSRIFRPYEQADDQTFHQYGGTGLGLSIVKSLVERMGGEIQVASVPAQGTEFTFTVRLGRVRNVPQKGAAELSLQGIPVLVLQKAGPERTFLTDLLSEWGMRVWRAGELMEALRLAPVASNGLFWASLDDFGFEAVEKLQPRLKSRHARIVLSATAGQRGDGARCQSLGAGAYLTGELEPEDLERALRLTLSESYTLVTRHTLRERRKTVG